MRTHISQDSPLAELIKPYDKPLLQKRECCWLLAREITADSIRTDSWTAAGAACAVGGGSYATGRCASHIKQFADVGNIGLHNHAGGARNRAREDVMEWGGVSRTRQRRLATTVLSNLAVLIRTPFCRRCLAFLPEVFLRVQARCCM